MKKAAWIGLWISFSILFVFSMTSAAKPVPTTGFSIYVNGDRLQTETSPLVKNDVTFVPARAISEAFGAQVNWEAETITIKTNTSDLRLTVGKHTAMKNGQEISLDAAPFIYGHHVMVPLRWIGEALQMNVSWFPATKTIWLHDEQTNLAKLPVVGDESQLKSLLTPFVEQLKNNRAHMRMEAAESAATSADDAPSGSVPTTNSAATGSAASDSAAGESASAPASNDHSTTNVQVEGVDEADIVKTDGEYIFQVNRNNIVVIKANPVEQMEVVSTLNLTDESFHPMEMYLDDKHLVVIGHQYVPYAVDRPLSTGVREQAAIMPRLIGNDAITALVYDRSDPKQLVPIRELALEGAYLSSRKIGSSLYIVSNQYIPIQPMIEKDDIDKIIPRHYDSAVHDQLETIDLQKMVYHPGYVDTNVLLVAAVDLNDADQQMEVTSFLGGGQTVYASPSHLYVAVTEYDRMMTIAEPAREIGTMTTRMVMPVQPQSQKTNIFRFALQNGSVSFAGEGSVPGRILNQFSMDEHNGHFRIATTTGDMWRNDEHTSKNHLFVLDDTLEIVGTIEDLAPGERIYSVRFMGDRGYIVTFRTVDPLFVIDLKSPTDPLLLGELKIPGYSDYLHPLDENHLIGFGKEVIVVEHKDENGKVIDSIAYDQGMKLSLFDITDVHNPVEKFTETIGGRGTYSDVLYNHKSLLFSKEKQLLAFPVTVMEVQGSPVDNNGFPKYGTFAFQGAYVYDVNIEQGFQLKGKITHLTEEQIAKSGQFGYGSDNDVMRIVTIGNNLYTLSYNHVKAHQLPQLTEKNHIRLH